MARMALTFKIARFLLPTLGAAVGAGAYVKAGGQMGGTAFLLIMHSGMLVGWVANRLFQSVALALGHLESPGAGDPDAMVDAALAAHGRAATAAEADA